MDEPATYQNSMCVIGRFVGVSPGAEPDGVWEVIAATETSHRIDRANSRFNYQADCSFVLTRGEKIGKLRIWYDEQLDREGKQDETLRYLIWTPPPKLEGTLVRLEETADHAGTHQSVRVTLAQPSRVIERLVEEETT